MTDRSVPVNDTDFIRQILSGTEGLLLDFDGPICAVFATLTAQDVATQLRQVLYEGGHTELPSEIEKSEDPFEVFRYAGALGSEEARYVEAALRVYELEAVIGAEPTLGAKRLVTGWCASGRPLAIVSNNSANSVQAYLYHQDYPVESVVIAARTSHNPNLLKPSPFLVSQAVAALGTDRNRCTMVGDSVADIQAGKAAGVSVIGYANRPGKQQDFKTASADAIIDNIMLLLG